MTVAWIGARGGSKGIPRKNLAECAGQPLICWAIEACLMARRVDVVYLDTDDDEIADIVKLRWEFAGDGKLRVHRRDPAFATDDVEAQQALAAFLRKMVAANVVQLNDVCVLHSPCMPLVTNADVDLAVDLAYGRAAIPVTEAGKIRHAVELVDSDDHAYMRTGRWDAGEQINGRELDYPNTEITTHYMPKRWVRTGGPQAGLVDAYLEQETFATVGASVFELPAERAVDIDEPWELRLADVLLRDRMAKQVTG